MGWLAYVDTEEHPATRFLGTTWEKIEDVFIKATSSNSASGQTGGSNTVTISKENLPNIKLQIDSFALTTEDTYVSRITGSVASGSSRDVTLPRSGTSARIRTGASNGSDEGIWITQTQFSNNTGTAAPYTSALGSGTPLDITPSFYTVHIWKRLT